MKSSDTKPGGKGFCGTPLQLFKSFLFVLPDGSLDASKIHSRECYLQYLINRRAVDTDSEMQKFRRTLSNQLSGVDGRMPFDPEEESAILKVLRVRRPWPCVPEQRVIGSMGFRSRGYHEKKADGLVSKTQKITTIKEEPAAASTSDHTFETVLFSFDDFDLPEIIDVPSPDDVLIKGWLNEII
jgi:hypothetical protein